MYQEDGCNASKQVCDALDRLLTTPPTSEQGQAPAVEREGVPMANPSWKQLAAIPESLTKRAVLHALGVEPPPAGISDCCNLGGFTLRAGESGLIVEESITTYFFDAPQALKRFALSKGTPSGDLARWWLRAKNLLPAVAP
jgi:hypothetical protein